MLSAASAWALGHSSSTSCVCPSEMRCRAGSAKRFLEILPLNLLAMLGAATIPKKCKTKQNTARPFRTVLKQWSQLDGLTKACCDGQYKLHVHVKGVCMCVWHEASMSCQGSQGLVSTLQDAWALNIQSRWDKADTETANFAFSSTLSLAICQTCIWMRLFLTASQFMYVVRTEWISLDIVCITPCWVLKTVKTDWLIDWLTNWLIDWFIDWLRTIAFHTCGSWRARGPFQDPKALVGQMGPRQRLCLPAGRVCLTEGLHFRQTHPHLCLQQLLQVPTYKN